MTDNFDLGPHTMSDTEFFQREAKRYREAALIAYGALVVQNGGRQGELFDVLNKYLFAEDTE